MTFEEYAKRLEEISGKLEEPGITLDQSISLFEESVKISSECMKILRDRKGRITEIKKELDGITEIAFNEGKNNGL
jgi:exodeoxyribonuclease VII small subunit